MTPGPVGRSPGRWSRASCTRWSCKRRATSRRYVPDPAGGLIGFDRAVRAGSARKIREARRGDDLVRHAATHGRAAATRCRATRDWAGGIAVRRRARAETVDGGPGGLWAVIEGIGGKHGWYSWALGLAGARAGWTGSSAARACAAAGATRTRCTSATRSTGGAWRTSSRRRLLRLRAEMRLPGLAWLELTRGDERDRRARGRTVVPAARATSTRAGCSGSCTGGPSRRSTASCSAACSATSRGRLKRMRRRTARRAPGSSPVRLGSSTMGRTLASPLHATPYSAAGGLHRCRQRREGRSRSWR